MEDNDSKDKNGHEIASMSERQAILYLEKSTSGVINNKKSEPRNIVLDYHRYYIFKKKQYEQKLSKEKLEYRKNLYKLSLKEYNQIKKSIYMDRKKNTNYSDADEICSCTPNKFTKSEEEEILNSNYKDKTEDELFGCGNCINKYIFLECNENCPCGKSCRNRKFQNQEYAMVYPIKTEDRGWGLCAGTFLPKDTFIMQYIGEIYSLDSEYGEKKMKEYKDRTCTYLMGLPNNNKHEVIDPTKNGNMARFINHSCDPNCETRKWHVKGELCIGIFAKKDIQEDEELTFNYDFDLNKTRYQKCLCGAKNCRGYLGISTEDNKRKKNLICSICKENCKHSESIIECKICRKFFHKNCVTKKGQLSSDNEYKCSHCIKKNLTEEDILLKKNELQKEKIRMDEEPIYDEILEVSDEEITKIKKNLRELINFGAGLFWDFQKENDILGTSNKIELKITGTTKQIEGLKEAIKKLKSKKEEGSNEYMIKLNIPKIYLRKIIGHQRRNLDSYKSKFGVKIEFDSNLITDDIFVIQENTFLEIKGKENNVKAVALNIKKYLYSLKVMSIYLLQEDYYHLRQNICNMKTSVDPADLRLRKMDSKSEREIKHPFYYIPSNIKDVVIIGFEKEIEKAKNIINNSLLRQNNISFNFSLSFLFPIYFRNKLADFISNNKNELESKKILIESIEPEYLRRHISIIMSGKWEEIIKIKRNLWGYLKNYAIDGVPKKHDINEFEQYAYNQEHKLISKSIRTYIVEQCPQIKNWDYISEDVEYLQQKHFNLSSIGQSTSNLLKESQDVIENFIYTSDKETRVNYLVNMRPGAYRKVFKMDQNDLFDDILGVLDETYSAYKNSKLNLENNLNNDNNTDDIMSRDNNKYNRNDSFAAPERVNHSIFHSKDNQRYNSNDEYSSSNNLPNYKRYMDNNPSNNQMSNLSLNKDSIYGESTKQKIPSRKSPHSKYYSGNINSNNYYSKSYAPTNNYHNYTSSYARKDDISSNSSYLMRKTNRDESKSSSEGIKDDYNYYHKRGSNKNFNDYDDRRYYGKYYSKYEKFYDNRYEKKGYKDYDYDDSSYNNNQSNEYSNRYDDHTDRGRGRNRERDFYRERSSYRDRSKSESPKNKYKMNSNDDNKGKYRMNNEDSPGKDYSYNYNNAKDNYKDYRIYSQTNRDNFGGRNYNNNEGIGYNDNRYTSKYNYDNGYYKKRYLNDNKYKGISSNDVMGKYSDRQKLSRSKNSRSRSRSKSWERGNRYINKDVIRRGRSNSNSLHKFNDNYE